MLSPINDFKDANLLIWSFPFYSLLTPPGWHDLKSEKGEGYG